MKLSIIIPYYNTGAYTILLLECLHRQMVPDVEVILVDDGSEEPFQASYPWLRIIRQKNGGASAARNTGLDNAKGEYIAFIDSDDLVADNYLQAILQKIETEKFDYCYLSWRTLQGGWQCQVKLRSVKDVFPPYNLCVWNRIYRKDMIGDVRFNVKKKVAEDAQFIREVKEEGRKKAFISEFMYFYRSGAENSLTKRFANGGVDTERIVYNIPHVNSSMRHLIEEFKEADEHAEVILMTNQNDIPELKQYAMVISPARVKGTELRGEPTRLFTMIPKPIETQVVIWTSVTMEIGGIETWIYLFAKYMSKYYDITVLYDTISPKQLGRLQKIVRCIKRGQTRIICDTCIVSRITDKVPEIVEAKQTVQMVHACKMVPQWSIPQDRDHIIGVSNAVLESFNEKKGNVIYNLVEKPTKDRCLFLISATRLSKSGAFEKGHNRMLKLADKLTDAGIPYLWIFFGDENFPEKRANMIVLPPKMDVAPYLAKADYYVSLSNAEGYGYSVVEALINGTPVITTPVTVLPELGFEDGKHGYIVPFDMNFDVKKLLDIPKVEYKRSNTESIKKWRSLLGNTEPKHDYEPEQIINVEVIKNYYDTLMERKLSPGEVISVDIGRAEQIIGAGFARRKP